MKVLKNLSDFCSEKPSVVTVGNFDGIHLGHQKILEKVKTLSQQYSFSSVVFTFEPHPMNFFGADIPTIQTPEQKKKILEDMDLDYLLQINFNERFAGMLPEVFVREVLVKKLMAKFIVVGYDYKFGKRRKGNFSLLEFLSSSYGYTPFKVDRVEYDGLIVSSTNIRSLLKDGKVNTVNKMLGRPFSFEGIVVHGSRIGGLLGYPTANIDIKNEIIPRLGVYASKTVVGGVKYNSVSNIGVRPTVHADANDVCVESFIFSYDEDLYGKQVELELIEFIRDEEKFESFEGLKDVIGDDCEKAKRLLEDET